MLSHHTKSVTPDPLGTPEVPEPAAYPMPAPHHDSRFTFGLTLDVGKVLAEHAYPPIRTGPDFIRLQQALFGFFYTLDLAVSAASPLLTAPADPGTPPASGDPGQEP
jgi:hypothetical protein